ncbi:MAG: molybdenum cofactor guanylyltransferase [Nitrospirota bacterium]
MTGIVLSGGGSRRMGTDKAFLELSGRPIIEHILDVLHGVFETVIIVTNSPPLYAAYDTVVVTDALEAPGPLTGIYSGLLASKDDYNFIVACDMPFLNPALLSYMTGLAEGYDAVVPKIGGFCEPLHAVYSRGMLPRIESSIRRNSQRLHGLFEGVRVRYVAGEEIDRFDPQRRSFKNLNTPQEYKEAVCSDLECRN